jgi:hypothetical protein
LNKLVGLIIVILLSSAIMASAESPILYIHSDNSVEINGRYVKYLNRTINGNITISIESIIEDEQVKTYINASGTRVMPSSSQYSSKLYLNGSQKLSGRNYILALIFNIQIINKSNGETLGFSSNNTVFTLNNDTLILNVKGDVLQILPSNMLKYLFIYSMLNKQLINNYLQQQNITYISINELSTFINENRVKIRYDVDVKLEELSREYGSINTTAIRKIITNTIPLSFTINMSIDNDLSLKMKLVIGENINRILKRITNWLEELSRNYESICSMGSEFMGSFMGYSSGYSSLTCSEKNVMASLIKVLREFSNRFVIEDSRSDIVIHVVKGSNNIVINYKSPRIVAKNAKSPKDTLLELYNFVNTISNDKNLGDLGKNMLSTEFIIKHDSNLKIMMDSTEVNKTKLSEINNITITTAKKPSQVNTLLETTIIISAVTVAIIASITIIMKRRQL